MTHSNYPLTLLYDGACAICRLEMGHLRERDGMHRLVFVDIADPAVDVAGHVPASRATRDEMLRNLHGVRPDGSLAVGVDALRLAYRAVGLGAWVAPTSVPLLKPLFERAYAVFASNRYAFSAAFMPLIERVAAVRAARRMQTCTGGVCEPKTTRGGSS